MDEPDALRPNRRGLRSTQAPGSESKPYGLRSSLEGALRLSPASLAPGGRNRHAKPQTQVCTSSDPHNANPPSTPVVGDPSCCIAAMVVLPIKCSTIGQIIVIGRRRARPPGHSSRPTSLPRSFGRGRCTSPGGPRSGYGPTRRGHHGQPPSSPTGSAWAFARRAPATADIVRPTRSWWLSSRPLFGWQPA
jgi:hypothetical protein